MVARRQARQVDVLADGDAGQDPVARRQFAAVGVDVDDDQAGRPAGDDDSRGPGTSPPSLDAAAVEGRGVEAVAPAACGQAGAAAVGVARGGAVAAVRGRGLAAGGEGEHGPAACDAPAGQPKTGDWALRRRLS